MEKRKKIIPLWIKSPLTVFVRDFRRLPLKLAVSHVYRDYAQNAPCSEAVKQRACASARKAACEYLSGRYGALAKALVSRPELGTRPEQETIWVFWWQGEASAPEIVKRCIASIRKQAGNHPVQLITEENYLEFADVAAHMEQRLRAKTISLTHFSDYYRMALLEKQGGVWIDASIFACGRIPDEIFEKPVFTMRNPGLDTTNISNWEWTVGVIGGWKGSTLFVASRQLQEAYWKDHNVLVDYFVLDYLIRLIFDNCPLVRQAVQDVAPSNRNFYDLQRHAEEPWREANGQQIGGGDTWLYKLSWKRTYPLKTPDGSPTVYAHWLQETGGCQ